jgi:hypothetical protein
MREPGSQGTLPLHSARDPKLDLRAPARKKNTKQWCRGKVGVTHQLVVRGYQEVKGQGYWGWGKDGKILLCAKCGKEIAWYVPRAASSSFPALPVPDWAK